MKTKKILLTALLVGTSVITAFSQGNFQFNLEKGKSYKIKSVSDQQISQNNMDMTVKSSSFMTFTPQSLENDYMTVTLAFDSVIVDTQTPMGNMVMNSKKQGNIDDPREFMSALMSGMYSVPYELKISYSGKIIEITNIKAISDAVKAILEKSNSPMKDQMKGMVEGMCSKEALSSNIEASITYLPASKQWVDKWETSNLVSANGMSLSIKNNYKKKSDNGSSIVVTGESTIAPAGNGTMTMNGMTMAFEMRGMGQTELTIDKKTGWIIKGKSKTRMSGSITANGNAMPMEITGNTEIEGQF